MQRLGLLMIVAWVTCAIAIWVLLNKVFGDAMTARAMSSLGALIYFVPVGAGLVVYEYVLRPRWFGPTPPGRRMKRPLSTEELRTIDRQITRRREDSSDG